LWRSQPLPPHLLHSPFGLAADNVELESSFKLIVQFILMMIIADIKLENAFNNPLAIYFLLYFVWNSRKVLSLSF